MKYWHNLRFWQLKGKKRMKDGEGRGVTLTGKNPNDLQKLLLLDKKTNIKHKIFQKSFSIAQLAWCLFMSYRVDIDCA